MTQPITVIKRNLIGEEIWRYTGLILRREPNALTLPSRCCAEAHFNRPDTPFQGILLKKNDRFVETYSRVGLRHRPLVQRLRDPRP